MRICSFLPSATEMVYDLGLGDQLFGVTHECDYPLEAKDKPHVVHSVFEGQEPTSGETVSYTHLTLPTKRIV